jgi:MFS family permease
MSGIRGRLPSSLVLKYYAYKATVTFGFFWPVFTLFLLHRDLTYAQRGALGSISAGITIVGEIPTGYVADRIGRRNSLLIASVLLSVSVFGFVVVQTFLGFAVLYFVWALGVAFQSGSGDAWLYDTLEDNLREGEYTRIRGRGGSVNQLVSAGTMLSSGVLYEMEPTVPFLVGGVVLSLSVPIVLSFPRDAPEEVADDSLTVAESATAIRETLLRPPLRSVVLYVALFFGAVNAADMFIQPVAVYEIGLSEESLGPLYAAFSIVAAVGSYYAEPIRRRLTTRWAFVVIPALTALFFVVPLLFPLAAFSTFFVMKAAKETMTPIASGYFNDRVDSLGRATLLSGVAMVYSLVRLPLKPAIGRVADATSPVVGFAALAGFFAVCSIGIYALRSVSRPSRTASMERSEG